MLDAAALGWWRGEILSPQAGRDAVAAMRAKTNLSERRACALICLSRTALHYRVQPTDDTLHAV